MLWLASPARGAQRIFYSLLRADPCSIVDTCFRELKLSAVRGLRELQGSAPVAWITGDGGPLAWLLMGYQLR